MASREFPAATGAAAGSPADDGAAAAVAAAAVAAATVGLAAAAAMPSVLLSGPGGVRLPVLGFGTGTAWFRKNNGELERAVANALTAGFRSLDSAEVYGNEDAESAAVSAWLQTTGAAAGVTRKDLVITSKILNSIDKEVRAWRWARVRAAFETR
jgi:aryl-alcohol dehydrogenase-like predicted oxidoreductase